MIQRYYSSIMGRFLTPDPSNLNSNWNNPQSWNLYTYVNGDPVNFNDPSGLTTAELTSFEKLESYLGYELYRKKPKKPKGGQTVQAAEQMVDNALKQDDC